MKWQDYIGSDKDVLLGKPTIKGTRLAVEHIVGLKAGTKQSFWRIIRV